MALPLSRGRRNQYHAACGKASDRREQKMSELEHWEARFAGPDYLFGTAPNAFLRAQAAHLKPGQKALTIADGEGRNGVWLAEQGLDVLAIDFSPTALGKARALAAARKVALRIEQVDVISWDWPHQEFDVIAAIFVQFAYPDDRARMFAGIKQALKPGGFLFLEGYGPKQLEYRTGGPTQIERLYTRELLEAAFGDLAAFEIKEYDAEINEGTRHQGMSALIDLVGRK
jgi:SAM-dependent methyltransferase